MPVILVLALLLSPQTPARTPDADTCLACHADAALTATTAAGETVKLHVDRDVFNASVHAKLACADCHADMTEVPHEARPFKDTREITLAYDEQCRRCHFANYTKTLDSVHQAAVARGDSTSPVCVDCHGSHATRKPGEPRTRISQTCAKCH